MSRDDPQDCLTVREGYIAMYYFVDAYWKRGGMADGSLALLTSDLWPTANPHEETSLFTQDPAFWSDWVAAVMKAREEGMPKKTWQTPPPATT